MGKKVIGIITLGLNPKGEYVANFINSVDRTIEDKDFWHLDKTPTMYEHLNLHEVAKSYDVLVWSPGTARVGLIDGRADADPPVNPHLFTAYHLIRTAANAGVPQIGIMAGMDVVNNAFDNGIIQIGSDIEDEKKAEKIIKAYKTKQAFNLEKAVEGKYQGVFDISRAVELGESNGILQNIENIEMQLTNNWVVSPKQDKRLGQEGLIYVEQIASFMGYPLMSKIIRPSDPNYPGYGIQFNIQPGTEAIFRNFFNLARNYLERKQA